MNLEQSEQSESTPGWDLYPTKTMSIGWLTKCTKDEFPNLRCMCEPCFMSDPPGKDDVSLMFKQPDWFLSLRPLELLLARALFCKWPNLIGRCESILELLMASQAISRASANLLYAYPTLYDRWPLVLHDTRDRWPESTTRMFHWENLDQSCKVYFQCPIGPFRADMMLVRGKTQLVVELDGMEFHGTPEAAQRDRIRDRALLGSGIHTVRFTAKEVFCNPAAVLEEAVEMTAKLEVKRIIDANQIKTDETPTQDPPAADVE